MDFKFAHLAETTITDTTNKLSIVGIFSDVNLSELPGMFGHMVLVVGLTVSDADAGHHREFLVVLRDPEGRMMREFKGAFDVPSHLTSTRGIHLSVGFDNLVFNEPGPHTFEVYVEGDLKETVPMEVKRVAAG